ncbi:MAG TPA: hypothetical protein VGR48_09715 [Terriglobales bacterium]|nr:hypothetical protein [Terriglobales bacterium]
MITWLRAAGAVQVALIAGNFLLPAKLRCRENLKRVSPIVAQVFIVHWAYIVLTLAAFAALCFWFPQELAGPGLGRFLAAFMAGFWLLRVPVQLFFYDPKQRREHGLADVSFLASASYLGLVFAFAALGRLR